MMHQPKCDTCGRFISDKDLASGKCRQYAVWHRGVIVEIDCVAWECVKCSVKPSPERQDGKEREQ